MNTDPHTKANLFYTVNISSKLDPYKWNVEIAEFIQEVFKYNGDEDKK